MKKVVFCLCVSLLLACSNRTLQEVKDLNFFGCASSSTIDVMVGNYGSILRSSHTSLTWEKVSIGEMNTLLDVFYSASPALAENPPQDAKFYAVGHRGAVFISMDGHNWDAKNAPSDAYLFAVAAHKNEHRNRIVAVGHKKEIYVSDDEGVTWQKKHGTANKKTSLYDVAFGDNSWLSVGDYGAVLIMDDATSTVKEKNILHLGVNKALKGIAFSNVLKRWVVVGHEGVIFVSDDAGVTWQGVESNTKEDLLKVAFNGKRFVAVGTHGIILASKDGRIWKKVQINNNGTFRAVACTKERWLLITIEGKKEVIEDAKME